MKLEKKSTNLSININNEGEDNDFLYCWNKFGDRPNKIKVFNSYLKEEFLEILDEYKKEVTLSSELVPAEEPVTAYTRVNGAVAAAGMLSV